MHQALISFIDECFAQMIHCEENVAKEEVEESKNQDKILTEQSLTAEHHVLGLKALLARIKTALA